MIVNNNAREGINVRLEVTRDGDVNKLERKILDIAADLVSATLDCDGNENLLNLIGSGLVSIGEAYNMASEFEEFQRFRKNKKDAKAKKTDDAQEEN